MKKILPIITLLIAIVGISACTNNSKSENTATNESSIVTQPEQSISDETIQSNKAKWEKKTESLKLVHDKVSISDYASFPTTLKSLKHNNDYIIKGTVVNLQKMTDNNQTAMTKATIQVDEVYSGNEKLKNHQIKVTFKGGITKDSKHKNVNVQKSDTPIPEIGSQIITGINSASASKSDQKNAEYLKENKLGGSNTFSISVPEYNLWVYDTKAKKYVLNNPLLRGDDVSKSNKQNAEKLKSLTKTINEKY